MTFLGWALPVLVFLATGAYFLLCFAVLAGASLPYQDAPPELVLKQRQEMEQAGRLMTTGVVAFALGTVALGARIGRWAWRRKDARRARSLDQG